MTAPFVQPDEFARFFEEVHGRAPFPWQARLAAHVVASGSWPEVLDLPTGTGKTAVLDIAVFAMACDAHRAPLDRRAPRRVLLVVDRRTVVDQAHDRACHIARQLETAEPDSVAARAAAALRSLCAGEPAGSTPLDVVRLRGAVPRDDAWARNPTIPLLGVSTVDQVGSQLLFRGYGVSPAMRSVHAGLLGSDTLYFLDEVHLSRPFAESLAALRGYQSWCEVMLPRRLAVVEMSATRAPDGTHAFELDDSDRADPVLSRRLSAPKPVVLEQVKVSGDDARRRDTFARHLAKLALDGANHPRHGRIAVVVNRVDTARAVDDALAAAGVPDERRLLITGRMRPLDRDDVEARLRDRVAANTPRRDDEPAVFVVATQCIEAGADLDVDVMITECASLDALVQRFGRLDRLGERRDARAVVAIRSDQLGDRAVDPVYGNALGATWAHLERLAASGTIDAGLGGNLLPPAGDRGPLLPSPAYAPVMLPGHLDLWSQTRPAPAVDPEVALWLHGEGIDRAEVSIIWRADVLEPDLRRIASDPPASESLRDQVHTTLTACPPSRVEALAVPIWAARAWLAGGPPPSVPDVEGAAPVVKEDARTTSPDDVRPFAVWRGVDDPPAVSTDPTSLRPGDTLIVPASYGGLRQGTWAPDAPMAVSDLGDLAQLVHRGRLVVRLTAATHSQPTTGILDRAQEAWNRHVARLAEACGAVRRDEGGGSLEDAFDEWLAHPDWLELAPQAYRSFQAELRGATLRRARVLTVGAPDLDDREVASRLVITADLQVPRRSGAARSAASRPPDLTTEDDGASLLGAAVTLPEHLGHVEAKARAFSDACGLPPALAHDVAHAAAWHDIGKTDPRFQRWLVGGDEVAAAMLTVPLAKSVQGRFDRRAQAAARTRAGYPAGARHELLSVAMLERAETVLARAHDRELFLHLVGSHHGWCRPFAPVEAPSDAITVEAEHDGAHLVASSAHGLSSVSSAVADRFWRLTARYGWHGLAWLEAIVRLADHRASEDERDTSIRGGTP